MSVPFFRPDIGEAEIAEVVDTLRSGWLTSGPKVSRFEAAFAERVGAKHALAVNSCTAAMHLAVEALGLGPGQAVLVPAMTFAATAEIVRYQGALPVLVDCDPVTLNVDLADAAAKASAAEDGSLPATRGVPHDVVGMLPVHVGGELIGYDELERFAEAQDLWLVEDAAHAFPAAWRAPGGDWLRCGAGPSAVTCFSFYANKTITTGEGGMATTDDDALARRMRQMALHGLSTDAWDRYTAKGAWDYRILAPGFKYNLTDIAAAIGLHQLARADAMRAARQRIAEAYRERLAGVEAIELPRFAADREHSWHLFPIKLRLEQLAIDRDSFLDALRARGIGYSVHWRPLHLHPYYGAGASARSETGREAAGDGYAWRPEELPQATAVWPRLVSLPIFPTMTDAELDAVVAALCELVSLHRRSPARAVDAAR